jgi:hypothetical protein
MARERPEGTTRISLPKTGPVDQRDSWTARLGGRNPAPTDNDGSVATVVEVARGTFAERAREIRLNSRRWESQGAGLPFSVVGSGGRFVGTVFWHSYENRV